LQRSDYGKVESLSSYFIGRTDKSYEVISRRSPVFLNRRAAARYRALALIILCRERPEETTICYKISLVQLTNNLNLILYLSTCHAL